MAPPAPRVLLLTPNTLQPHTGGGVLLANLFHAFPRERMFSVHADTLGGASGLAEARLTFRALRPRLTGLLRFFGHLAAAVLRAPGSLRKSDVIALALQACRFELPRGLDARIRRFAPEIIYAWTGDSLWARLVAHCAERYRVPYVIHFMDNHVELPGETPLQRALYSRYRADLLPVVAGAEKIFTISRAMGHAYGTRFGKATEVFHGLIDKTQWPWPDREPASDTFSLVFTGSIESGQLSGLAAVAAAVDRLAARGRAVRLVLYLTPQYEQRARGAFGRFNSIEYRPHPEFRQLRETLNNADVLILAYGFDEQCVHYYRYSFATKVVPYMLSGRCILAYGPASIEPIAYLKRGGWAHVVDDDAPEALDAALEHLMNDAPSRVHFARRAYEAGLAEHDLELNSRRFVSSLRGLANRGAARDEPVGMAAAAHND